jgi:internalin A
MRSCGLCFVLRRGNAQLGVETEYIAPELLPSREDIEREIAAQWDADTAIEVEEYRYEFLHQGLIRAVIAKIGLDAGLSALYWRDGLCAYEEITRSRAVIEQRMDPGWSGRIVVQTRGGQARQLLSRLCNLVEEQQNRIGLEAVRKGPTIPVRQENDRPILFGWTGLAPGVSSLDLAEVGLSEKEPLTFGAERSTKPRYCVSYAWADLTDPNRETIVDQACEEAERRGTPIIRDKTTLTFGDSVAKFMRAIGEGERIFIVLSDKYLKSPYCMYELFEIWRNSRQEKTEFLPRIRIYTLDDARIWKPIDRLKYAKYWKDQHDELKQAVEEAGLDALGEEDHRNYRLMEDFANKVGDILALFASVVQPRSFDDLKTYGFNDPPVRRADS